MVTQLTKDRAAEMCVIVWSWLLLTFLKKVSFPCSGLFVTTSASSKGVRALSSSWQGPTLLCSPYVSIPPPHTLTPASSTLPKSGQSLHRSHSGAFPGSALCFCMCPVDFSSLSLNTHELRGRSIPSPVTSSIKTSVAAEHTAR